MSDYNNNDNKDHKKCDKEGCECKGKCNEQFDKHKNESDVHCIRKCRLICHTECYQDKKVRYTWSYDCKKEWKQKVDEHRPEKKSESSSSSSDSSSSSSSSDDKSKKHHKKH